MSCLLQQHYFFQQKCLINSLLEQWCCLIDTGHKGVWEVLSSSFHMRSFKFHCCMLCKCYTVGFEGGERGPEAKKHMRSLDTGKGKETHFLPGPPEGTQFWPSELWDNKCVFPLVTELGVISSSCPRTQMYRVVVETCGFGSSAGKNTEEPPRAVLTPTPSCQRAPPRGRSPCRQQQLLLILGKSCYAQRRSSRPEQVEGLGDRPE